jgi:calcium permeable stress-gated cation channel
MPSHTSNSSALIDNNSTTSSVNKTVGQSASSFAASLITAIVVFAIEVLIFVLIKDRFARIYQPRTYLVPEKERTAPPRPGWFLWIKSVLSTSNSEFIQKCGLDAYFFLRYLRTLIKIFVPALCLILPVLIPINLVHGRGGSFAVGDHKTTANVTGLDTLAWGNVRPDQTNRYWAHLVLAVALVAWVCYISFDELRGYIRMRQAYLTSPQHRLRASATTVLVSSIPSKWCTVEALDGLYDVFPGGLRNIWINRNYDDLTDKIKERDKLATKLEGAETDLIKKCWKAHQKKLAKEAKKEGGKASKESKEREDELADQEAERNARSGGVSTNNPHQVRHTVNEAVNDESDSETDEAPPRPPRPTIPLVGEGIEAVTKGLGKIGKGMFGGLRNVQRDMNDTIDTTNGFVLPGEEPTSTRPSARRTDSDAPHARPDVPRKDAHAMNPYRGTLDSRVDPNTPALRQSNWQGSPIDDHEDAYDMPRGRSRGIQDDHDDRSLSASSPATEADEEGNSPKQKSAPGKVKGGTDKLHLTSTKEEITYPPAYKEDFATDGDHNVVWKKYIAEKDRDTMRLPIFGWQWMISLPLMGQKVDTIYYCRKELARLNLEIEQDQENPERFPLMNSAFVQFNHQVAAHMACQSLSHHLPKQMAPRLVEISPNDVIWDNMSIPWWQNYIRTAMVVTVVIALIILWAIPVSFTSGLSQINQLAQTYEWLKWLTRAPKWLLSILQGVLPALFLSILLFLLPIILRFLVRMQGTQTGMLVELSVQKYYLFFLFVQLFIVVTIANAAATVLAAVKSVDGIKHFASALPTLIGQSIPRASNYFFSYMLLQALSVSAGALVQIGGLFGWFIMAPLFDNTARSKFKRQTSLSQVSWGTFFPVYTNLACIGTFTL